VPFPERLPWHAPQWTRVERMRAGGRMPHALLLSGPRGVGKTWFARRLAAALLCLDPRGCAPCGACQACHWMEAEAHPDLLVLRPQEANAPIRVEAVRELIGFVELTRSTEAFKVALVLEAERMNASAANSLLKTLEEPTPGTVLLLVTAAPSRLPATVRSRCQGLRFPAVGAEAGKRWLQTRLGREAVEAAPAHELRHPLRVMETLEDPPWGRRPVVLQALADAVAGRVGVLQASTDLEGLAPELVLEWMVEWASALVRMRLGGAARPDDAGIRQPLASLGRAIPLQGLWVLYDALLELRKAQLGGLNEQLFRERLVLDWVRAASEGCSR